MPVQLDQGRLRPKPNLVQAHCMCTYFFPSLCRLQASTVFGVPGHARPIWDRDKYFCVWSCCSLVERFGRFPLPPLLPTLLETCQDHQNAGLNVSTYIMCWRTSCSHAASVACISSRGSWALKILGDMSLLNHCDWKLYSALPTLAAFVLSRNVAETLAQKEIRIFDFWLVSVLCVKVVALQLIWLSWLQSNYTWKVDSSLILSLLVESTPSIQVRQLCKMLVACVRQAALPLPQQLNNKIASIATTTPSYSSLNCSFYSFYSMYYFYYFHYWCCWCFCCWCFIASATASSITPTTTDDRPPMMKDEGGSRKEERGRRNEERGMRNAERGTTDNGRRATSNERRPATDERRRQRTYIYML